MPINPLFTDHNAACVVVEEDHNYFMNLVRDFFQTFTELPIGDSTVNPSVATAIFLDSREAVDTAVADGNSLEFGRMDPVAAAQGPEAFANQQV